MLGLERARAAFNRFIDGVIENQPGGRAQAEVEAYVGGKISLKEAYKRVGLKEEILGREPGSLRARFDQAVSRAAEDLARTRR